MISPDRPAVSFVVLSYNFSRYLHDCVESILRQSGSHSFEVILVDDASTDSTAEILQSFDDPRIRIIQHEQNQGHAATVNDGMKVARGAHIARIDGDDRYRPDFLSNVLPIFQRYPEVGLVYGDAALIDTDGMLTAERSDRVHNSRDFKGNELIALLENNFICAPTVIARREAWETVLPAPGHLAFHDWYFTTMMARNWEFYYLNQVLADYRVHSGNLHSRIILDRTEEPSIFWMLDHIYSSPEQDPRLEDQKYRSQRRIYGKHYARLADNYFGANMDSDAQRCFWRALLLWPKLACDVGLTRRLLGTIMGRRSYEQIKAVIQYLRRLPNQNKRVKVDK